MMVIIANKQKLLLDSYYYSTYAGKPKMETEPHRTTMQVFCGNEARKLGLAKEKR